MMVASMFSTDAALSMLDPPVSHGRTSRDVNSFKHILQTNMNQ